MADALEQSFANAAAASMSISTAVRMGAIPPSASDAHAPYSRFYLPRLRRWSRERAAAAAASDDDDRITQLVLDRRELTDADCLLLADALRVNGSLTYLSIAQNPAVTAGGVAALADAIADHPAMRVWRVAGEADLTGPKTDVAIDVVDDGDSVSGAVLVDPSCPWVPPEWQAVANASDLAPEAAPGAPSISEKEVRAARLDVLAIAGAYQSVEAAVLRSQTLARVFLPAPPPPRLRCGITDGVIVIDDPETHFGAPDVVDAKRELAKALRAIPRSLTTTFRVAALTATTSASGGGGNARWKRCVTAALTASTKLEDAAHDLSAAANAADRAVEPAPLLTAVTLLARVIAPSTVVKRIDLSGYGAKFGDAGVEALVPVLATATGSLQELSLRANDVSCKGAITAFDALATAGNTSLTELDLSDNRIADRAVTRLHEHVRKMSTGLAFVNLDGNCVTPDLLARVLQNLALNAQPSRFRETLLQLEGDSASQTRAVFNQQAAGVRLSDVSCRLLMQALRSNTRIVVVDVSYNAIGDDGAAFLAEVVAGNRTLRRLIAQCNHIGDAGAHAILEAIPRNPAIEIVDLANQQPPISAGLLDRVRWLSSLNAHPRELKSKGLLMLQDDPSLTEVRIAGYDGQRRLTESSVHILCEMLAVNSRVTGLTIADHPPSEGILIHNLIPHIASTVVRKLKSIDLTGNGLTDANSLDALSAMLTKADLGAASLRRLVLARNDLSNAACETFASLLRHRNATLTELDVSANPRIDAEAAAGVRYAASLNMYDAAFKQLILDVESNSPSVSEISLVRVDRVAPGGTSHHFVRRYDDRAAELLAEALEQNSNVTSVNLNGNSIGDDGAAALASMLRVNTSLTALHLSANVIGNKGVASLSSALLEAHSVRVLTVDGNRDAKDPAALKSIQLSLAQNAQSVSADGGPNTTAIYSTVLTGKRAKLQRAAEQDRIVDQAIFDDAMADFHAAERRQAAARERAAEAERQAFAQALANRHSEALAAAAPKEEAATAAPAEAAKEEAGCSVGC